MVATITVSEQIKQKTDRILDLETALEDAKKELATARRRETQIYNDLTKAKSELQELIGPIVKEVRP